MTSFMDSIYAGKDRFVQDQERKRQETTRRLFGDALQNKPDALTQLYAVDPATALKAKEQQKTMQIESAQLAHRAASAMHDATPEQRPQIYGRLYAEMSKHPELGQWVKDLPAQYDPATVDPIVQGIIAQTGIYQDPQSQGQETWMNGGNGTMISNRGNSKPIEGYVQKPAAGAKASNASPLPPKLSPDEIAQYAQVMLDGGMPDDKVAAWAQAENMKPDLQNFQMPARNQPSAASPQKPAKLSAIEQRVNLARKLGASEDEIKAIVLGGKGGGKATGTGGAPQPKDPTEDQSKAAAWYAQGTNAYKNLMAVYKQDPTALYPGMIETYSPNDEAANRSRSPARQKAYQAASSLSEALLRAATGAGITIDEAQQKIREITPQRGDTQEVIDQKLAAIPVYLDALRNRAGRAIKTQNAPNQADAEMTTPRLDGPKRLKFNPATGKIE